MVDEENEREDAEECGDSEGDKVAFIRQAPVLYPDKYQGGNEEDERAQQGIDGSRARFGLGILVALWSCRPDRGRGCLGLDRFGRFDLGEHGDDAFAIGVARRRIDGPKCRDFLRACAGELLFECAFAVEGQFGRGLFLMLFEVVEDVREAGVVPVNPGIGGVLEQFFVGVGSGKFAGVRGDEFFAPYFRPRAGKVFCPQRTVALKGQREMGVIRDFEDAVKCSDEGLATGHKGVRGET